jgi:Flp pilus assembly protein CpaB
MKPKAYIFAGLAIVCGLGASYMTSRLLAERTTEDAEKIEILVAKRQLNVGERIVRPDDMFEMKAVLKENEPPDAIKDFEAVKGKIMKQGRNKGDHVTASNLYDKDLLDIPEGHQAVGLAVNLATTAHGLATLPGSRVNLILTVRGNDPRSSSARVLLQNVLVLAADGRTNREGGEGAMAPASVVTFALTQKDALKVSLAKELGILSLSLRKLNAESKDEGEFINGNELFEGKRKEEPKVEVAVAPPPVKDTKPEPKVSEEAKDIRVLTIGNGVQQSRYEYEVLPNGQVRDAAPGSAPPPPPPQNSNGKGPQDL